MDQIIEDALPKVPFEASDAARAEKILNYRHLEPAALTIQKVNVGEKVQALRLVNKTFNKQTRAVLNVHCEHLAQTVFSDALTKIALAYHKKLETDPEFEQGKFGLTQLSSNINRLCTHLTYKTQGNVKEPSREILHIGIDLHEIYAKTQDWKICTSLMKVVEKQKNIHSLKLEVPFLLEEENKRLNIFQFIQNLIKNSPDTLQSISLNFSYNPINFLNLENLFKFLRENKISIKELNLGNTGIENGQDIQSLFASLYAPETLEYFSLQENYINTDSMKAMLNALQNTRALHSLNLGRLMFNTTDIIEGLTNWIKTRAFEFLGMQDLDSPCTKKFYERIACDPLPRIRRITMNDICFDEDGAEQLANFIVHTKDLEKLELSRYCWTDSIIFIKSMGASLAQNRSIRQIDLFRINMGIYGLDKLSDGLKKNTTVQHVRVSNQARTDNSFEQKWQEKFMQEEPRITFDPLPFI